AAALFVTALGFVAIYLSRQLPYSAEYGPGAGFLPFWLGVALVLLSAILWRNAKSQAADDRAASGQNDPGHANAARSNDKSAQKPWLIFFGSIIALAFLFQPLGLLLSSALFMLVTMRWAARRTWVSSIVFAVVTPIALYVGFTRLLVIPLPLGPFGP
ncbi:MAG TPA: tripartite tricarboxylate transporter TctB family protein, partial [Thermomicrobiales bacterium]|nr:tripartite tricarboxylate transporter TctB family protein [Thermomicrobiales bacterium]